MQGCNHHNHQLKEKPIETSAELMFTRAQERALETSKEKVQIHTNVPTKVSTQAQVKAHVWGSELPKDRWKLCSNLGVSRAVFILVILILGMVVLIAIPYWKDLSNLSEDIACEQAMKSARDGLIIEYLGSYENSTVEEAMLALDEIMPARADICPAHGTVYLIRDEHGIYEPICGLHASDAKLRTRLNASRGLDLLQEALRKARRLSTTEPESVEINLNGKPLECQRVKEEWALARGTDRTADYEGVIVLYGLAGDGDFKTADTAAVKENEICYFVYADEKYCAVWHASDGWTGDSYNGI